jgi:hypothetical protein
MATAGAPQVEQPMDSGQASHAEKAHGHNPMIRLRKLAVWMIEPEFETMDLSYLNDDNDPLGVPLSPGGPRNQREFWQDLRDIWDH